MKALWWRIRDWYIGTRTRAAIAERECKHDETEPLCGDCIRNAVGW